MGIDYSLGKSNFDDRNGIRFGIIPAHEVGQAWYDESEAVYPENACPECGSTEIVDYDKYEHEDFAPLWDSQISEYACEACELSFDLQEIEAITFEYEKDGYVLRQSTDDSDIWVFKSPFYTVAGFCSPCAPGAVYLTDSSPDAMAYCLGANWFESGKAPYKVFSVETGEEVPPAE